MSPIPQYTGPPSPERYFGFAGGRDKQYTPSQIANTGYSNMLRNGMFESWSQGSPGRPDAWETNAVGTYYRSSVAGYRYWGQYALYIQKTSGDGDVSIIQQSIQGQPSQASGEEKYYTFSFWCMLGNGDEEVRPFFYDGSSYYYGPYASSTDWEEIVYSFYPTSSATDLVVGIQFEEVSANRTVYIDCAQLLWGEIASRYMEHHDDRSVICQHWEDDGTRTEVRGAMRAIPYEISGTTTGGSGTETVGYTLQYGCRQVVHASANLYSYTGTATRTKLVTNNYSTTGFDIVLHGVAMNIEASKDYVITGCIWCIGWDVNEEQWK